MGWFLVIAGLCLLSTVSMQGVPARGQIVFAAIWITACVCIIAMGVTINKDWFF